jgi:hypothetical protein
LGNFYQNLKQNPFVPGYAPEVYQLMTSKNEKFSPFVKKYYQKAQRSRDIICQ